MSRILLCGTSAPTETGDVSSAKRRTTRMDEVMSLKSSPTYETSIEAKSFIGAEP